jgi:hypothetical protein
MKMTKMVEGHGDDQVLGLGKEEREKQKAQGKGISARSFLVCTQDTIEGVSDLGLIAVLLRWMKLVSKCSYHSATRCCNSLHMH